MDILTWIYNFFKSFFGFLIDIFVWLLESFFYILSEFPYLLFDGFLVVIEGIFTVLDLSGLAFDTALNWSSLPDQLVWILGEIDFSQGLSIIISAIGIRMLINLIPGAVTRI
jgi:hypothetical protein